MLSQTSRAACRPSRGTVVTRAVLATRPLTSSPSVDRAPATPQAPVDTRGWLSMGLTKATLTELSGIQLNKTVNGNTWSVMYDSDIDELTVVDKSRGLRFPAVFGDDNRVKVDVERPVPYAVPGLHLNVLGSVLRADSPGAEIVNGRAAMVGIVAALAGEYQSQETIARQLFTQDGASAAVITGVAILAASVAPAMVGRVPAQTVFPSPEWPYPTQAIPYVWNYEAERLNGRLAMLGFMGLMMSEVLADRQCGIITKMFTNWSC